MIGDVEERPPAAPAQEPEEGDLPDLEKEGPEEDGELVNEACSGEKEDSVENDLRCIWRLSSSRIWRLCGSWRLCVSLASVSHLTFVFYLASVFISHLALVLYLASARISGVRLPSGVSLLFRG